MLSRHGVTCLRLMMEYADTGRRYLEQPVGQFRPAMVAFWDDLFELCERYGLRILLTPFDTFWMWRCWERHPYNKANGGPCSSPGHLLTCPDTRRAIKARLEFATRRWGGAGALFAWDLWNEIHPAHAGDSAEIFDSFICDLSSFLRSLENELHGRAHPQTVSVFYPHVELDLRRIPEAIFRHPSLDFANTHLYAEGTIDDPQNTVDPAIATGRLVSEALGEIRDRRPFFDSEHGPIHTFKDRHLTLPEDFDAEYFRHMQWAHFASGGPGGGMRWPNRTPHRLTVGMRNAQRAFAGFLPFIDWGRFQRRNCSDEVRISSPRVAAFCCACEEQAVLWLLRRDTVLPSGRLDSEAEPVALEVTLPQMRGGDFRLLAWDTFRGRPVSEWEQSHGGGPMRFRTPPFRSDLAIGVTRL
jgi:mannan endo-1,4-beta-mannosidase